MSLATIIHNVWEIIDWSVLGAAGAHLIAVFMGLSTPVIAVMTMILLYWRIRLRKAEALKKEKDDD